MSHLFYVVASYGAAAAIVFGLILWVAIDGRARRRELQMLEASGIRRRSSGDPS
ncbi:heme exporter protein CcmD [Rhizobium sp. TRM95111]|uniref:heme exporter protein CcmD n=1 Tax=Rhizobium alarense TaxID=2846851 RepID=UPI001F2995D1|nr:heme exporter protein CcmD [Rhizobium alarense]MCF3641314.1 heme exporter protein CcmD [Rhizobium alarense]